MFSNAVFVLALRAVSRALRIGPVGLDLTGPSHEYPFAFDDDRGAACASPEDLSVSGVEVPASLLPPPVGPTSSGRNRFCKEARSTPLSSSAPSAAPGAARTYEASLRANVLKVSAKLSSRILPTESEGAFLLLLHGRVAIGPHVSVVCFGTAGRALELRGAG